MNRVFCLVALLVSCLSTWSFGEDLWLAADGEFPGRLRFSQSGSEPRVLYTRASRPDPAYPNAIMKTGQIAVTTDGEVYYCSGLDGSLMHLLNGRHEIQAVEVSGQVRDLACTSEPHTLYYSIVPTPINNQPLSDGLIARRDFWQGSPDQVAVIRQADIGGNWWGIFTIKDGDIYLATMDFPSRIFRWSGGALTRVFPDNQHVIKSLSVSANNRFLFADGNGAVWETTNFSDANRILQTSIPLRDIASAASPISPRP